MRLRGKLGEERQSSEKLILLVVILFTTLLVIGFIMGVRDLVSESADGKCAAEVRKAHLARTLAGREFTPTIENCITKERTLTKDELPSDPVEREKEIEHVLAEEMRECWQEWGSGELDLFKESGQYCHVCSVVTFDQNYGEIKEFDTYMLNTKAPTGKTYVQIFSNSREQPTASTADHINLPTDEKLAVIFQHTLVRDGALGKVQTVSGIDVTPTGAGTTTAIVVLAAGGKLTLLSAAVPVIGPWVLAPIVGTATVATATGAGLYAYAKVRFMGDFYSSSAIYITPLTADNPYVQECKKAAAVQVSP